MFGLGSIVSNVFDPGDLLGYRAGKNVAAANSSLDEAYGKAEEAANKNSELYSQYMDKVKGAYGNEAANLDGRVQALENLTPYDAGQFSYGKDIGDFYSKFANQRKQQAMDSITNSMANAGNMFSSDYTDALAASSKHLRLKNGTKVSTVISRTELEHCRNFLPMQI